ncbi:MAG: acetyl-CoA carboxylase biotin carboxyl carrier protein [Chloroflexota bacterium]
MSGVDDAPDAAGSAAVDGSAAPTLDRGNASLLALVDRLAGLLDRSDLSELEVEAGGTALVLRKPVAIATSAPAAVVAAPAIDAPAASGDLPAAKPSVKAPLTGIFYASPAPGSPPYVQAGNEIAVGQVIGLIEAMKLFNEIKSDIAGRVVRVVAESGQLVKSKQPLVEVDPL